MLPFPSARLSDVFYQWQLLRLCRSTPSDNEQSVCQVHRWPRMDSRSRTVGRLLPQLPRILQSTLSQKTTTCQRRTQESQENKTAACTPADQRSTKPAAYPVRGRALRSLGIERLCLDEQSKTMLRLLRQETTSTILLNVCGWYGLDHGCQALGPILSRLST